MTVDKTRSSSVWYYKRKTMFNPVEEGPITEQELKELVLSGAMDPETPISSPLVTNGNWVVARSYAGLVDDFETASARAAYARESQEREAEELALQQREERLRATEDARAAREARKSQKAAEKALRAGEVDPDRRRFVIKFSAMIAGFLVWTGLITYTFCMAAIHGNYGGAASLLLAYFCGFAAVFESKDPLRAIGFVAIAFVIFIIAGASVFVRL